MSLSKYHEKVEPSLERKFELIRSPVVTEKSTLLSEFNQVSFHVPISASKPEIKAAVEDLFKVNVTAVNTLISKLSLFKISSDFFIVEEEFEINFPCPKNIFSATVNSGTRLDS